MPKMFYEDQIDECTVSADVWIDGHSLEINDLYVTVNVVNLQEIEVTGQLSTRVREYFEERIAEWAQEVWSRDGYVNNYSELEPEHYEE